MGSCLVSLIYITASVSLGLWTLLGTEPGWGHVFAWGFFAYAVSAIAEAWVTVRYMNYQTQATILGADEVASLGSALTEMLYHPLYWTKWPRILAGLACFVAVIVWLVSQ